LEDGRVLGLDEVAEVEAEEGVSARDGDGEWRRREGGVAGAGERRTGGGESGGEGDSSGAVMRVIGDELRFAAGAVVDWWGLRFGGERKRKFWALIGWMAGTHGPPVCKFVEPMSSILFAVTEFLSIGSQVSLLFVIDVI
jgi:hypothetical protein